MNRRKRKKVLKKELEKLYKKSDEISDVQSYEYERIEDDIFYIEREIKILNSHNPAGYCPECGKRGLVSQQAEFYCNECGIWYDVTNFDTVVDYYS